MKTPIPQTAKIRPKRLNKSVFNKSKKSVDKFIKHVRLKGVKDKNPNDRLEILQAKYEQDIRTKESELATLRAKLATLRTLAQESEKLANPESEPDKYATWGLTQTILDAVERLKGVSAYGANTSQIRDYMIASGFRLSEENPHNFSVAVAVTLQRLKTQGRVKLVSLNGNNFWKPA
jgi:hypothetical protein